MSCVVQLTAQVWFFFGVRTATFVTNDEPDLGSQPSVHRAQVGHPSALRIAALGRVDGPHTSAVWAQDLGCRDGMNYIAMPTDWIADSTFQLTVF